MIHRGITAPTSDRVHYTYHPTRGGCWPACIDVRLSPGNEVELTTVLSEVTCQLCRYKLGIFTHPHPEIPEIGAEYPDEGEEDKAVVHVELPPETFNVVPSAVFTVPANCKVLIFNFEPFGPDIELDREYTVQVIHDSLSKVGLGHIEVLLMMGLKDIKGIR